MSSTAVRLLVRVVAHVALLGVVATLLVPSAARAEAGSSGSIRYVEPVDAPVVDPFRAPASTYGPGNRGLEYDTVPGTTVRAAAGGEVQFAGDVAGALHVTILHGDGRRSSYSFLRATSVRAGQRVEGGDVVGVAGELLHVSMREGDEYVDPAAWFGTEARSVSLVPENPAGNPLWQRTAAEAVALWQLTLSERPSLWSRVTSGLGGAASFVWDHTTALAPVAFDMALLVAREITFRYNPLLAIAVFDIAIPLVLGRETPQLAALRELNPLNTLTLVAERGLAWWMQRGRCTPADVAPPPPAGRHIAVLVAGLDSTDGAASIGALPTDALGYAPGDVIGFSYEGGRTSTPFDTDGAEIAPDLASIPVRPYDEMDSSTELARRGALLADLLEEVAESTPGATVDLYGHSQGGIVVRLALADLARRPGGAETIAALGLVATMGTPHQGADLATMALVAADAGEGQVLLDLIDRATGLPTDPDVRTNLVDLAVGSDLLDDLADQGLPEGPRYLSLAARGDLVVAGRRTELDGARHVTVPVGGADAHTALPGHPSAAREVALGLAGMDPTCESVGDFIADLADAVAVQDGHAKLGGAVALAHSFSELPTWVGDLVSGVLPDAR